MFFAMSRLKPRGLRFRIVVWMTAVLAASLLAGFFWVRHALWIVLSAENDAFLARTAAELATVAGDGGEQGRAELEAEIHREVDAQEGQELIVIVQFPDSTIIAPVSGTSRRLAERLPSIPTTSRPQTIETPQDGAFRLLHISNANLGRLDLALSLRKTRRTLAQFDRRVAAGGLVFLAISLAGGFWLAQQAVRPVAQSIDAARQLNPADLTARLPRTGVDDELDQLAGTINDLLDRLARYHAQIIQFTADASHELRSPLAAMRAAIEVALQQPRSADEYRDQLGALAEQCDRLAGLVNSLLLLARADAGQIEIHKQRVDLRTLAANMVELYQPLADERSIALSYSGAAETSGILGDAPLLQQLVANLIDNALKFTPAGGHVDVGIANDDKFIQLRVQDDGAGIPPDKLPHVFERFYQADAARASAGTGLGLSICQWIVEAHGGAIEIINQQPGTLVEVRFTVARSAP
jgi:heavy metal sensor kinase